MPSPVRVLGELQYILKILDKKKGANEEECLTVCPTLPPERQEEANDLVWRILSHPYSKINQLEFRNAGFADALALLDAAKIVRKWCELVPATRPREISFRRIRDNELNSCNILCFEQADDLRMALTYPGNRVEKLTFERFPVIGGFCDMLLRPVFENPNNELLDLLWISSRPLDNEECHAFAKASASQHCKLKSLKMPHDNLTYDKAVRLVEALKPVNCLESLQLPKSLYGAMTEFCDEPFDHLTCLMNEFASLLERPGNKFRSLPLTVGTNWREEQALILARTLTNEHCRLDTLDFDFSLRDEASAVPIFRALRHPSNHVRTLSGSFFLDKKEAATTFVESLNDPNCKLEVIQADFGSEESVELIGLAIANVLETSSSNRLRSITLEASSTIIRAFTKALQSPNNRLTCLRFQDYVGKADESAHYQFQRALRRSNVVEYGVGIHDKFWWAFHMPFLKVMYTLLSVRTVPRLGQTTWLRILPVQDFILMIAKSLGWPIQQLCV